MLHFRTPANGAFFPGCVLTRQPVTHRSASAIEFAYRDSSHHHAQARVRLIECAAAIQTRPRPHDSRPNALCHKTGAVPPLLRRTDDGLDRLSVNIFYFQRINSTTQQRVAFWKG